MSEIFICRACGVMHSITPLRCHSVWWHRVMRRCFFMTFSFLLAAVGACHRPSCPGAWPQEAMPSMLLLCAVCVARGDGVLGGTSFELPWNMVDRRSGNYGIQAFYSHLCAPWPLAGGPPTGRPILYRLSGDGAPRQPILYSSSSDVRSSPACPPPLQSSTSRPASRLLRTHWAISPPALAAAMSQRQLRWNRAATCTRADGHRSRRRDADGMPDCQSAYGAGKAARGAAKTQPAQCCLKQAAADTCILMSFFRPRTRQRGKGPRR